MKVKLDTIILTVTVLVCTIVIYAGLTQSGSEIQVRDNQSVCGYQVTGVQDGDTFYVTKFGQKDTIRIANIDTPELKTKYNNLQDNELGALNAMIKLSEKILDKEVCLQTVERQDKDNYGRLVRDVYVNNINIGKWLVNEGYAVRWVY